MKVKYHLKFTAGYIDTLLSKEDREKIDISFSKVAAHTGVKYNEMADQLAKAALGL